MDKRIIPDDFDEYGHLSDKFADLKSEIIKLQPDLFDVVETLNKISQEALYSSHIKTDNDAQYARALIFLHILRTFQAFVQLCLLGLQEQSIMMLRVCMEALFKLKAIKDNPKLIDDYMKDFEINRKTYGQNIIKMIDKGDLEYEEDEVIKIKKDFEELEQIKKDGFKTNQWAKEASLENMYMMLYPMFSQPIHSNPHQLDKYLDVDEYGNVIAPNPFPKFDQLDKNLHFACTLLLISTDCIDDMLKKEKGKASFTERLNIIKRKLVKISET